MEEFNFPEGDWKKKRQGWDTPGLDGN